MRRFARRARASLVVAAIFLCLIFTVFAVAPHPTGTSGYARGSALKSASYQSAPSLAPGTQVPLSSARVPQGPPAHAAASARSAPAQYIAVRFVPAWGAALVSDPKLYRAVSESDQFHTLASVFHGARLASARIQFVPAYGVRLIVTPLGRRNTFAVMIVDREDHAVVVAIEYLLVPVIRWWDGHITYSGAISIYNASSGLVAIAAGYDRGRLMEVFTGDGELVAGVRFYSIPCIPRAQASLGPAAAVCLTFAPLIDNARRLYANSSVDTLAVQRRPIGS